ncbi:hypothetical protein NOF04DRAFT_5908 [Fusarium oxysporum II5]|uniref:Uncharacterized protein n=3 Tax=Fusarium oxysporum species complex TaxID=171631 RepID=N4UJA6_FUSC1|nr:uncharacterized protein FOIG_16748 [Fusarium odoratissimum NRRL 54006]ENH75329.1 hypothetical protein FOC1_g10000809 [Fusarium oxysporum f. sp. cubense race 1]KAK2122214.1 hypothetical protein NOF04DRAFT_5908 [Fusarium oxysporum II5]TVY74283.1 hypothetical protein Focb16_v005557 [Fusarium oxysporum f. sp. cubense]EXL89973.1 hypothetical protein FOIG_16748 [Fusarium odoratissimum NRRL 54006]TXB97894.1 hypothetical protein FocTR4_00017136 [Fusarium oxysporum f. sp. cubense]
MTRQNLSGPQANSSTLCDRPKPASTDRKDQSFTEAPPDHDPARPQVNQPGSSDSENIETGETAESPEHTQDTASKHFVYYNAVAGPGIDQLNGDFVTISGASANSNNDGLSSITEVHNNALKIGRGSQHNGFIINLGEGGTLENLPNFRVTYNNPTCWADPSVYKDGNKIVGTQHNGCIIMRGSAPVKD